VLEYNPIGGNTESKPARDSDCTTNRTAFIGAVWQGRVHTGTIPGVDQLVKIHMNLKE